MIEMAVLGLLKERSMHGYELKKELTNQLGQFWQVSYGSLYPAIRRLEKESAVERIFPKEDVTRRRNIYRITPQGEGVFDRMLSENTAISDDARFGMKLAFARYLKPKERVELLERRRAYLTEWLMEARTKLRSYKEKIDAYTYRLMEHRVDTKTREVEWIDSLIAEEKSLARATPKARTKRSS